MPLLLITRRALVAALLPALLLLAAGSASGGQNFFILAAAPSFGLPGETLDVTLGGRGFSASDEVFFGDGITVNSVRAFGPEITAQADHILVANITIDNDAEIGPRDIDVEKLDGDFDTLFDGFLVGFAPSGGTLKGAKPALKFGTARLGRAKKRKLKLQNRAATDLRLYIIAPNPFLADGSDEEIVLGPREKLTQTIEFEPGEEGNYNEELLILTSDPNNPVVTVDLIGRAKP